MPNDFDSLKENLIKNFNKNIRETRLPGGARSANVRTPRNSRENQKENEAENRPSTRTVRFSLEKPKGEYFGGVFR